MVTEANAEELLDLASIILVGCRAFDGIGFLIPRPNPPPVRVPLVQLWQHIPDPFREQLIRTLSRMIRRPAPPPPTVEGAHE